MRGQTEDGGLNSVPPSSCPSGALGCDLVWREGLCRCAQLRSHCIGVARKPSGSVLVRRGHADGVEAWAAGSTGGARGSAAVGSPWLVVPGVVPRSLVPEAAVKHLRSGGNGARLRGSPRAALPPAEPEPGACPRPTTLGPPPPESPGVPGRTKWGGRRLDGMRLGSEACSMLGNQYI